MTELQDAWVADIFGIDPRQYRPSRDDDRPAQPDAVAGTPTAAQDVNASCLITITNDTKSVLKLAHQGHDFGDFVNFPASTVQPGASTRCVSTHTLHPKDGQQGCKGFLEWTILAADAKGSTSGGTAATWRVEWTNPVGEKNTASAALNPPSAGFTSLEQIGEGDENVPVVFTLSTGRGAAAQQPMPVAHKVEITIRNATDAVLLLDDKSLEGITTDSPIPGTIAAGQTVTLVAHCKDWTGAGLLYRLIPAGAARPLAKAPSWAVTWHVQPGPKLDAEANVGDTPGGLMAEVKTDGISAITFELSGQLSPAAQPPQQRIDISIGNKTDQTLRFIAVHDAGGKFEPAPPNEIAPGATISLVAVGSGPTGANIIYQLEPKGGTSAEPESTPWWTVAWDLPPGQKPKPSADLDPRVEGIMSTATAAGDTGVAFTLSGKAASGQQSPPKQQDQRTEITLANKTSMVLRRVGADRTTAKWDPLPPKEIAPGATVSFATITSGEVEAGLMYAMMPADSTGDGDANTPRWLVWWTAKPGEPPFQRENIVPEMPGIRSGSSVDKNSIYFELSGKAAPGPKTQPQQDQRTEITLGNKTNMVLRRVGADRTTAKWDPLPPKDIAPGSTVSFATITSGEVEAGLMYAILPAGSTGDGDNNTPRWLVWWTAKPGEPPFQRENVVPVMPGIHSGSSVGNNTVYFELSGQWSPQTEQKIGVTIKNQTASKLHLIASDASGARFDPAAPKDIAPGDTVSFAAFSKDASGPKLSYEVSPREGATQGAAKAPVWTISWQTRPGAEPKHSSSVTDPDTADFMGWGSGLVGNDGVSFEISTHGGSGEKR